LTWLQGEPLRFDSSPKGRRWFCGNCGTQLTFAHADAPALVDVTLASLDDPEAVRPEYHVWVETRIGWMETADRLPRHEGGGPDAKQMVERGGS
jgi:hypothetical protein